MSAKDNRMTYRLNDEQQKLYDINGVNINKISEGTDLKRAFTIVPNEIKKSNINKEMVTFENKTSTIDIQNTSEIEAENAGEKWPDLEELEALIRGENKRHENEELEQLELPLTFDFSSEKQYPVYESKLDESMELKQPFNSNTSKTEKVEPIASSFVLDQNKQQPVIDDALTFEVKGSRANKHYDMTVSWTKVTTAIASSIITGVLIGYVLLLAVYGANVWPINIISHQLTDANNKVSIDKANPATDSSVTLTDTNNQVPIDAKPIEVVGSGDAAPAGEPIIIQPMQSFEYIILQAGVFTKEVTKQAMVEQLKGKGFPAASFITQDGSKQIVIAGIASSLQATYQTNHMDGIELYKKTFSVHIPKLSEDLKVEEQAQQWIFNVHDLLKSYMRMSEAQLEQASFSAIYNEGFSLLQEKYNALINESTSLNESIADEGLSEIIQWHVEELNALHKQFTAYQEKPSLTSLLQAQQHLLNIIVYQTELYEK